MAEMSLSRFGPDLEDKLFGFARPFDVRIRIVGPTHLLGPTTVGSQVPPGFGYGRASDCRFFRLGHPWYYPSTAGGGH